MRAFCLPPTAMHVGTEFCISPGTCSGGRGRAFNVAQTASPLRRLAWRRRFDDKNTSRTKIRPTSKRSVITSSLSTHRKPARIAVLVSGGGRSLENICEKIDAGTLTGCEVSLVIASKNSAGAIENAERCGIPTRVLRLKDFERSTERFSDAISNVFDEYDVDLVVLAGWMHFYLIPSRYEGHVINIHPSLIPAFCGKGYFGHHVHEAVLDFGAKVTGCTVHLADNKYDHGPIILQKPVAVHESDTADDLASRVFESEKEALPEAIQLFVDGKLSLDGRLVRVNSEPISNNV